MPLHRLNGVFKNRKVDAVVVSNRYNVRYLSRYTGDTGWLYLSRHKKVLLTDARYTIQAAEEADGFEIVEVTAGKGYEAHIASLLKEEGAQAAGFEADELSYNAFVKLEQQCENEVWTAVDRQLAELRMIKTEDEIAKTKKAQEITDKGYRYIQEILKPGMTEQEAALELEYFMRKEGAERLSFDIIAASGVNSSKPHAIPETKKLEPGDFLTLDFGCVYEGYCSDMTRTVVIGKASEKQKQIYETVLAAQEKALGFIRAGITGRDADECARKLITAAGYGTYFKHSLGHGTGLFIHELPRLSMTEDMMLEENMIVTVEPGIYIPGFGGVRIEDMVVVKKDGCLNLTESEKKLVEIPV